MAKIVITDINDVREGDKVHCYDPEYGAEWSGVAYRVQDAAHGNPLCVANEILRTQYFVKATRPGPKFPKKFQSIALVDETGDIVPAIKVGYDDEGCEDDDNLWLIVYDDGSFRTMPQDRLVLKEVIRS